MRPSSNQPARFFATAKTQKFDQLEDIYLADLKLRPIIDQTGSCYSAGKVLSITTCRVEVTLVIESSNTIQTKYNQGRTLQSS